MKWKKIIRLGLIIYTFFLSRIECDTILIANNYYNEKSLTNLFIDDKINTKIKLFQGNPYTGEILVIAYDAKPKLYKNDAIFLTEAIKSQIPYNNELVGGIPNDAVIQEIVVDFEHNYVKIDMSSEYDLQNYGGSMEYLILQSLVNTAGYYYNVDHVMLTVEGKPYCSGHFCFEGNQLMDVIKL